MSSPSDDKHFTCEQALLDLERCKLENPLLRHLGKCSAVKKDLKRCFQKEKFWRKANSEREATSVRKESAQ